MDITHHFTDEQFRQHVLNHFCGQRGLIEESDVQNVTTLALPNLKAENLAGIEHFRALEELDCSYNRLTTLNLSENHRLRRLKCNNNDLLALDVSMLSELEMLECSFNRLRALDVSGNPKLRHLQCHWNMLSELNLENNVELRELSCSYNAFFSLELLQQSQLERLDCSSNYISHLDVASCSDLLELRCHHNHITKLELGQNTVLQSLRCFNNHLTNLDLQQNTQLRELYCSENKLTKLDVGHLPRLEQLQYGDNLILQPDQEVYGLGIFRYDGSMCNYTLTLENEKNPLVMTARVAGQAQMEKLIPLITEVWKRFDELRTRALEQIAQLHPDEDVNELVLAEVLFEEHGDFRIGFDAGDTPAGQLYLFAEFDKAFNLSEQLVYETY